MGKTINVENDQITKRFRQHCYYQGQFLPCSQELDRHQSAFFFKSWKVGEVGIPYPLN